MSEEIKSQRKILLCGYFAFGTSDNGGQPVKSRETYWALCNKYGKGNVHYVETLGWKKHPLKLFISFFKQAKRHDYIIMLPAHHGLMIFSRMLMIARKLNNKKIYYSVIGGWLPTILKEKARLKKILQKFDGIFVETSSMYDALICEGFNNVHTVPNFKSLPMLSVNDVNIHFKKPYPLCMFSRIMQEKGVEDAINAVIKINTNAGEVVYTLNLFGQIDSGYKEHFEKLMKTFPEYIRYRGIILANESVATIKNYFALLFPTHYYTEGIPGTLIDACTAGVPVITSLWLNYKDVFVEGKTGWGYEFGKNELLQTLLEEATENPVAFYSMRESALKEAEKYRPNAVVEIIDGLFDI